MHELKYVGGGTKEIPIIRVYPILFFNQTVIYTK